LEIISHTYSLPYICYIGFLAILSLLDFYLIKKGKERDSRIRFAVLLSFSVFFGLKGFVGRDVFYYFNFFESIPTIWHWHDYSSEFEIGYQIYAIIIKSIYPNFFFFTFVSVLIDAWLIDRIIKRYTKIYVLPFIIFIGFYGIIFEMEQMRNAKAVLIFMYSLRYVSEKRPVPYVILNAIGLAFHNSAIFYIVIYPLLRKRLSYASYITIYIIGTIIFATQFEYIKPLIINISSIFGENIQEKATYYVHSEMYSQRLTDFGIGFIERSISYILFTYVLLHISKRKDEKDELIPIINTYVLYFIFYYFFSEIYVVAIRGSALFIISYIILFCKLYEKIGYDKLKYAYIAIIYILVVAKTDRNVHFVEYTYYNVLTEQQPMEARQQALETSNKYYKEESEKTYKQQQWGK